MALIENEPIRQAFLASGLPQSEVCRRLGWLDKRGKPETSRLSRLLGLQPSNSGTKRRADGRPFRYEPKHRERMRSEIAADIVEALGLDPVDVGI